EIGRGGITSQRELSRKLGYALGLTNFCIKQFIKKGYITVTKIEKNRLKYFLTPKGVAKRGMLTIEYLRHSYSLLNNLRDILKRHFKMLAENGHENIILYGSDEVAELSYLDMRENGIKMIGVIDDNKAGEKFLGHVIKKIPSVNGMEYDKIVVTYTGQRKRIKERMIKHGISEDKISFIEGL
ncbi:MAG: winged helix-turn-helix transcriptional regulator, partial [Nitrospirota bacterium]